MRGGIYPDDLLLFPLQLDELPSTRAELLYHVCTTTKQPPRGCCWCSVLPSTESLVSSDLSWKITPNDQDAGGACLLLLSYRLYILLQIGCTKHLKLSGVPGFQLWTIHIHISLHVEWIVKNWETYLPYNLTLHRFIDPNYYFCNNITCLNISK